MHSLRRTAGLAILALVGAFILLAPRPRVDNSVAALLDSTGPLATDYKRYQERFGTDETVLVQIKGTDPALVLEHTKALQAILSASPAIEQVISPLSAHPELCAALCDPVARDLLDPDAVRRTLGGPLSQALPLLKLSPPEAIVLGFGRVSDIEIRRALLQDLEGARAPAESEGLSIRLAGSPLLNLYLDQAGRDVERTALPLLVVICVALLLLITRSPTVSLALLVPVAMGVFSSDAMLGAAGQTANVMVNVVKPLLFVLLLAAGVHVATRFFTHRRNGYSAPEAAWTAARDKGRATAWALVTTAIGFGSLAVSDVGPIQTFGLLSAAGLLLGIPLTLLVLPALLATFARGAPPKESRSIQGLSDHLVQFGLRHPRFAIGLGLLPLVVGALVLPQLRSDPHAIRYFEPDHVLRTDHEALEAAGLGLASLEVILTRADPWTLDAPTLAPVEALRISTAAADGVQAAVALPLLLKEGAYQVRGQAELPDAVFSQQLLDARPGETRLFLSTDGRSLRLTLFIESLDATQLNKLQAKVLEFAEIELPAVQVHFGGSYPLLVRTQHSLLATLRNSLLITLVLMELILLFVVRHLGIALVALIPNLLPISINFIVMAVFDIPVDLGTSMTAAVALGIAVDDTLHVALSWSQGPAILLAERCGRAIVISSLVIGLGFLALTTSSFGPTKNFGLLAGLAMLTALLGDLVILPPLLHRLLGSSKSEECAE